MADSHDLMKVSQGWRPRPRTMADLPYPPRADGSGPEPVPLSPAYTEPELRFEHIHMSLIDLDFVQRYFGLVHYLKEPPTMFDENPFLTDILAEPRDDAPRLVCADWEDERAESLPVQLGEAYRAHAELIRLQIDVANGPPCPICHRTGQYNGTHERWCELIGIALDQTDIAPTTVVRKECPCPFNFAMKQNRVKYLLNSSYPVAAKVAALPPVRIKGFDLWRPSGLIGAREVRYVRGFVGLASYRVSDFMQGAAKIGAAAPLESIIIADRVLNRERSPFGLIGYFYAPTEYVPQKDYRFDYPGSVIPEQLWDLAALFRDQETAATVDQCYIWLARAAVWYARAQAKLPKWGPWTEKEVCVQPVKAGIPEFRFDSTGQPFPVGDAVHFRPLLVDSLRLYAQRDDSLVYYKGLASYELAERLSFAVQPEPYDYGPDEEPEEPTAGGVAPNADEDTPIAPPVPQGLQEAAQRAAEDIRANLRDPEDERTEVSPEELARDARDREAEEEERDRISYGGDPDEFREAEETEAGGEGG